MKYSLIFILLFVLLIVASVGGAGITITPENNANEYPNLIVKNGANILANFSLIENSKNCAVDCYAVINITSYLSAALPNSFDFKDSKSNSKSLPFDTYFYNYTKYNITTLNYDNNCTTFIYYNVTLSQNMTGTNCTKKNTSNSTKTYVVGWQTYQGQTFQAGNHTLKIVGHKNMNDAIDWGFSYQGILGDEIRQYWAWWNASWNYMEPITNITSDFVILYIPIVSGKMNPDFSDLRFTDILNASELGYWIESYNTTTAVVRVNMNKNTSLNMWYGNKSTISSKSNIQDVYWTSVVDFWDMENQTSNYLKLTNTSSSGALINFSNGGRFGKFVDFTTGGHLDYADNPAWDFTSTGNFTILTYIKKPNTADCGIVSRGTSNPEMLYYTQGANGVVYIFDGDQNTATTGTGIGTRLGVNTWQLLGITQSSPSNWTWWLNGTLVVNEAITMTYDNTNAILYIGNAASRSLAGGMDDVLFLNKSLNPVEMKAIYNTSDSGYIIGTEQANTPPATPVNLIFNLQNPSDVTTINLLNAILNISYNFTNGTNDYFNASSIRLYTKVNTTISDCSGYFNGTARCGYDGIRFVGSSGGIINSTYYFSLDDNEVYPAIYNYPDHLYMETANKSNFNVNNPNTLARANFLNMTNATLYNWIEVNMQNISATSNPATIWYCNSSYSTGVLTSSLNCVQIATVINTMIVNHTHSANSQHFIFPFTIINGKVSNTTIATSSSSFIVRGANGGWNVRYIANKTRTNAGQTSTNLGGAFSELAGTFDIHFHQYTGTEKLFYKASAMNSSGVWINSTESTGDLLNLGGIPPSSPHVFNPTNQTYNSTTIDINYTQSYSPNGYAIMFYNISLYNSDLTFNRTIQSNNSLNLSFVFSTSNLNNGTYFISVTAYDNLSQSSTGFSDEFIFNTTIIPSVTIVNNTNVTNTTTNIVNERTGAVYSNNNDLNLDTIHGTELCSDIKYYLMERAYKGFSFGDLTNEEINSFAVNMSDKYDIPQSVARSYIYNYDVKCKGQYPSKAGLWFKDNWIMIVLIALGIISIGTFVKMGLKRKPNKKDVILK